MRTDEYISALRKDHNIIINIDNDEINIHGSNQSLTTEIVNEIKARKSEILTFFKGINEGNAISPIPAAKKKEYYHLSSVQKRLYFLYKLDPDSLAYNTPRVDKLEGELDIERLKHTFYTLFSRHESLRSRFVEVDNVLLQTISEEIFPGVELFYSSPEETDEIIQKFIRPFDLAGEHLLRVGLIETSPQEHFLLIDLHHIIADGYSVGILIKEFIALYKGEELPPIRLQFKDYAEWQQEDEQRQKMEDQKKFWLNEFRQEPDPLNLPADFARPAIIDYSGDAIDFEIGRAETFQLKALAENQETTLFMVLLAVYNIMLSKLGDQEDIVVGTPIAGRQHPDLENVIGMFVNTLPLRNYPKAEQNVLDFLSTLKSNVLACFDNQDFPYEDLVHELNVYRDPGRNPLFDAMFIFEHFEKSTFLVPGLTFQPFEAAHRVSKFDITLKAQESDGQIYLNFEYSTALFKRDTIGKFISYFRNIISFILTDANRSIAEIELITENEKQQLSALNNTDIDYPAETVISLFREQAKNTPGNVALSWESGTISYLELDKRSDQIAAFLQHEQAIRPGDIVGVLLDKSDHLIASIFGILKAGAAYIPIDPNYPKARIYTIIKDSGLKLLLTQNKHLQKITACPSVIIDADEWQKITDTGSIQQVPLKIEPSWPAYIIYTSGSSGRPKGVMIEHGSLSNIIQHLQSMYPLNEKDRYLLKTTYSFDVSCTEIFGWFLNGGALVIPPEEGETAPEKMLITIEKEKVTHINFVPSLFSVFLEELEKQGTEKIKSLKYIFLAGEALPVQLVQKFHALNTGISLYNLYGPTEGTIYSCGYDTAALANYSTSVPIGKPLSNIRLYVLDRHRHLQPLGVPGELYIGGKGVARGYIGNEALTSRQFVDSPFRTNERLYKTGDKVRWLTDGNLQYLGRMDEQVKIRGYRIEPGEIENRLAEHEQIRACVAGVKEKSGSRYLVAFYVAEEDLNTDSLRGFLLETLPDYMVPHYYVRLDQIPLNANGKIDRKSLPDIQTFSEEQWVAPWTKEESLLAEVWSQVMGVKNIGRNDNFFSVGGDSIKSIQICSRMRSAGYEISIKDVFANQTIRKLAGKLKRMTHRTEQSAVIGTAVLTPVQQWFFNGPIKNKNYFTQSVLLNFEMGISGDMANRIFKKIQEHHDALRIVFKTEQGINIQQNLGTDLPLFIAETDLRNEADPREKLLTISGKIHAGIALDSGPLMRLGLFHMHDGSRLLIVIHHLVVDGISWRILFEDIETLYLQSKEGVPLTLTPKTDSFLSWSTHLDQYAKATSFEKEIHYWQSIINTSVPAIPKDYSTGYNAFSSQKKVSFKLNKEVTDQLLTKVHVAFNTQINDILLSALLLAISKKYGHKAVIIDLESHGRVDLFPELNIHRTVGWFTSIYPVLLEKWNNLKDTIRQVKEHLRNVPAQGIGYLLARNERCSNICFNYLGQFDADMERNSYSLAEEDKGSEIAQDETDVYEWSVSGMILYGQLEMSIRYSEQQYSADTMSDLMNYYQESLQEVIAYCSSYGHRELTPSDLTYKSLSIDVLDKLQQQYAVEDIYLLSPMQEGILYHAVSGSYSMQMTCRLTGNLHIPAIEKSMNYLMARYDVLRTNFLHDGYEPHLQLVSKERKIDFKYLAASDKAIVQEQQLLARERPFDLSHDVLIRLVIVQTGENEYEFIWNYHHLLMDGWCMGILVNEFTNIYTRIINEEEIILPPVKPYSQYIEWLTNSNQEASAVYWQQYLSSYDRLATLPQKKEPRTGYVQHMHEVVINNDIVKGLQRLSRQYGVTINTILQAAWGLLLCRYNNTEDVVFGSVVSGRPAAIEGVETMIGLFINTIPVRIRCKAEDTVKDFLQGLQTAALESDPHHYHPLSEILSLSELGSGLLDHIIAFENFPLAKQVETQDGPFVISNVDSFVQTNYDINITISPMDAFVIRIDFNSNKYEEEMIGRIGLHLKNIISSLVEKADGLLKDVSLYNKQETAAIQHWLTTDLEQGILTEPIQKKLASSFHTNKERIAIEYHGQPISYEELGRYSARAAAALSGIPVGSFVGVLFEDKLMLISSILGILQSRMAFVPLETTLPVARLSSMIGQVKMRYILTDQGAEMRERIDPSGNIVWLTANEDTGEIKQQPDYDPEDHVYVYFTSGSTGTPKGVIGRNKGLSHFIQWEISTFHIDESFRFSQFTNPGFDVFMRDIFVPLCAGATICIPDEDSLSTSSRISNWIDTQRINLIHCVPSFFKLFSRNGLQKELFGSLKYILLAGEKILPYELKKWYQTIGDRIRLVNIYGPTETTLAKGYYLIQPENSDARFIPLRAIKGAQFLILDKHLQVCPPGITGEIYIRTPYRSAGYLDAAATERSFIINPYSGKKEDLFYRTGDIGREGNNRELEITGRADQQVKIRGIRIEPDDIRQNILQYPGISDALVMTREDPEGETILCAYLVAEEPFHAAALRAFLDARLPRYMVPSYLLSLPKLPLLANGKVDRKALPDPHIGLEDDYAAPTSATEHKLADIWSEVLKIDKSKISTTKTFFELGGHSVKIFRLINLIQQDFAVKLKLGDIFSHNSIRKLARFILTQGIEKNTRIPVLDEMEYYPTSPAQKRMYYQYLQNKDSVLYNIPVSISINGEPDIEKIKQSFQQLINRHPGLRTSFVLINDNVFQKINDNVNLNLEIIDDKIYKSVNEAFNHFIRPFDLSNVSLLRCGIFRSKGISLLFVDVHHIVSDGISMNILIHDFKKIYLEEKLKPLDLRYVDYAGWINNIKDKLPQQKEYWLNRLSGQLPESVLPDIRTWEGANTHIASEMELELSGPLYQNIKQFISVQDVSDFMFHLSVCYILLSKLSGKSDIIIGTDVVGRTQASLQHIVGIFVNILPLRLQVKPESTYNQLLQEVKQHVLEGFDNQDFQFEQMVSLVKNPLVDFHLSVSNLIDDQVELETFEYFPIKNKYDHLADYELQLIIREEADKTFVVFSYNPELYDVSTIEWMMKYYLNIIKRIITNSVVKVEDIMLES